MLINEFTDRGKRKGEIRSINSSSGCSDTTLNINFQGSVNGTQTVCSTWNVIIEYSGTSLMSSCRDYNRSKIYL